MTGVLLPPFDAVVFDMDGLLLDSETLALDALRTAAGEQGIALPEELCHQMIGVPADTCRALVRGRYGDRVSVDRLFDSAALHLDASAAAGDLALKPGAAELLDALGRAGTPCAVATSSSGHRAHGHLRTTGILDRLPVIVTRDQVARGKPHPDLYLAAAAALDIAPDRCLALEDSYNGVRAAAAAGMPVVMVPDLLPPTPEMRQLAWAVAGSLHEVLAALPGR